MLPKSKALIDLIKRRVYRNSRCSRDTYKDIHLTEGGLRVYEISMEKSAEVIVPTGKRAVKNRGLTKLGRTEPRIKYGAGY